MNLIVFHSSELASGNRLTLTGDRARHLDGLLGVQEGAELRVGEIGGGIGIGTVVCRDDHKVVLEVVVPSQNAQVPVVDMVLALPRPQMFKRILQTVAVLGVRRLMVIRSARVERSFFQSPVVTQLQREHFLRLGMEQGMTTYMPEVLIFERFKPFVEDELESLVGDAPIRLIAHPGVEQTFADIWVQSPWEQDTRVVVAVGPEGGWQDFEIERFVDNGFVVSRLGNAIMTVEMAVCAVLAQLEMLRLLRTRKP